MSESKKGIFIGKHYIERPIIQGGMGVGISWDQLAGTVSSLGALGTVSAVCTGYYKNRALLGACNIIGQLFVFLVFYILSFF